MSSDGCGPPRSSPRRLARLAARAGTLAERLGRAGGPSALPDLDSALAPWARACARGDRAALERRLAWDGISPAAAAAALAAGRAEPPETPDPLDPLDQNTQLPGWLEELLAWGVLETSPDPAPTAAAVSGLPFGELWAPWVAAARRELERATPLAALVPEADLDRLAHGLAEELARVGALAAFEAFSDWRAGEAGAAGAPPGADPYARFVASFEADGYLSFYESFPLLLRQVHRLVTTWRDALAELLARLERDREALARRFGELGPLVGLERLAADRHAGGRGVFALAFASGVEVVYKPRPLAPEAVLERWAAALAARGLAAPPRALGVLERDGYGWMERARAGAPAAPAEIAAWYRSAGALVALAELLGGQDLHAENVIATVAGPVVVDAEMLLQPLRAGADPARDASFAAGLLARPGADDREAAWAGLEPVAPRRLAGERRTWTGIGSEAIEPAGEAVHAAPCANAPLVAGRQLAPAAHAADLLAGYAAALELLAGSAEELAAADGPLAGAGAAPVRLLFRPSQDYAAVLDLLARPRYQRDGAAAGLLLEGLLRPFAEHANRPLLWPLVAAERRALEGLDVPRFEVAAGAVALEQDGERIEGFLVRSGVEQARRRLAALDPAERARRCAAIAEALAARGAQAAENAESAQTAAGAGRARGASAAADPAAAARALGDRLAADLDREPRLAPVLPIAERLAALALYDGRLGVALALAEVDRLDGGGRAAAGRARLLEEVAVLVAALDAGSVRGLPLGALDGLGSLAWGLVALAGDDRQGPELAAAARLARRIAPLELAGDARLDLEGGAAGAALALLAVAQATGEARFLETARAAGARLLAAQSADGGWAGTDGVARAGLAHGASGMARALAALAAATGDAAAAAGARAGFAFERTLFDPARANWPVLVADPRLGEPRRTWMTAWCHGAPGVALARAAAGAAAGPEGEGELETAAATTLAAGLASHDHLCCGSAGRLAILDDLGRRRGRQDWREAARALAGRLLERAGSAGGPRCPPGSAAARRGLFRGEAGVAWALARLAGPARTPDLLLLETPGEAAARRAEDRR